MRHISDGAPAIADYALLGDGRTAALVALDGSVDWWCRPRFDSPAALCRLLDPNRSGILRVGPTGRFAARRRYLGATGVLETIFEADGRARVTDLLAGDLGAPSGRSWLLRLVEGLGGDVTLEVVFQPTFDYAATPTTAVAVEGGALARAGGETLALTAPLELRPDGHGGLHGELHVVAGDRTWIGAGDPDADGAPPAVAARAEEDLARTVQTYGS